MAVLPVLTVPDARLRQVCAPVVGDVSALAADLLETMYVAPGRGLAAPQVGALLRLFVMDEHWKDGTFAPQVFVNPRIVDRFGAVTGPEGCLSIPGGVVRVTRAVEVMVEWSGLDGGTQAARLTGFAAICAQHEIDHLDGVLTLDHGAMGAA